MRFQRRHDLTGLQARRFMKGISKISGLAEVTEASTTRIWIRGEPQSVEEFLQRVYGARDKEQALEDLADNERELGIGLAAEGGGGEEKGEGTAEKGGNAGESI